MLQKQPAAKQEVPARATRLLSSVCFCSVWVHGRVHGEESLAFLLLLEASEGSVQADTARGGCGPGIGPSGGLRPPRLARSRLSGGCCSPGGNLPSESFHIPPRATLRQPLGKTTLWRLFLRWNEDNLGFGFPSHKRTRQNSFFLFKAPCAPRRKCSLAVPGMFEEAASALYRTQYLCS